MPVFLPVGSIFSFFLPPFDLPNTRAGRSILSFSLFLSLSLSLSLSPLSLSLSLSRLLATNCALLRDKQMELEHAESPALINRSKKCARFAHQDAARRKIAPMSDATH